MRRMMTNGSGQAAGTVLVAFKSREPSHIPLRTSAAVDSEGRAYFGLNATLWALSPHGDKLWERPLEGAIPGPVAVGVDGFIRVHAGDGKLYVFNSCGDLCWEPVTVGPPLGFAAPTMDPSGRTYIHGHVGGLYRLEPRSTRPSAPFWKSRKRLDAPSILIDGVLYTGGDDHCLHAIDAQSEVGSPRWDTDRGQGRTTWSIHSEPIPVPLRRLLVPSRDQTLRAFAADGSVAWTADPRGQMLGSPVIDGSGVVLIGVSRSERGFDPSGALVFIRAEDGETLSEFEAQGPVESTPVIGDDGVVYFGDNAGFVHALDPAGQELWMTDCKAPVRSAGAMLGPGRVAFGTDAGELVVLACSSLSLAASGWPKFRGGTEQSGIAAFEG
jgi:outer membrane protein assembly factor BamB